MAKRKYALPEPDREIIEEFILRIGGTGETREAHRSLVELVVGDIGKPIDKVTDVDVFKERDHILSNGYKPNYTRKLVFTLRRFFNWYWKKQGISKYDISGIELPPGEWKCKEPDQMLTPKDIETILKAAHNSRDKCFIMMLWDGSNRPIELLNLSWKDLKDDEYGYSFKTAQKTGKPRHIRLTVSIPYIEQWKRDYPGEPTGNQPVFVTLRKINGKHKPLMMDSIAFMFQTIATETGIKNLKPGNVRPSRITDDVNNHYPESYLKMKNWGNLKTPMLDKYTNLQPDFIDKTALKQAKMERGNEPTKTEKRYEFPPPDTCSGCGTINIPGSAFCATCRAPLTHAARSLVEREKEQLTKDILAKVAEMMNRSG